MKKLTIGIITHNFPSSENDRQNAGIFVYDLAKALSEKTNVVVLSPGPVDGVKNIGAVKTHFFKFNEKLGNLKTYNPVHLLKFWNFFKNGKKALNSFVSQNPDLDFVISMWAFPGGYFANSIFKQKKIPYAVYCLGSDIYVYAKKPLLNNLIKKYLNEAEIVFADSPNLAEETKKLSGRKTIFLPSASNFPVYKSQNLTRKNIVLTFLGRLEKVKGIDVLIEALQNLGEDLEKFEVNIIGTGSLEGMVRQKINTQRGIKYWGNIDDSTEISKIFAKSDWLMIPSRSDSIPLVFSEAMKSSLPVVVSDLPDLKYLVDKYKVGVHFEKANSQDLVAVLKRILMKNYDYSKFKKNTEIAAHKFDLRVISDMIISTARKYI